MKARIAIFLILPALCLSASPEDARLLADIPAKFKERGVIIVRDDTKSDVPEYINFRIINSTDVPIHYIGYSLAMPWYRIQSKSEGSGKEVKVGWFCGTGLEMRELPSGKSVIVPVTSDLLQEKCRVGVDLTDKNDMSGRPRITIWSDE